MSSSTAAIPLSVGVATNAPMMSPPPALAPLVPSFVVLVTALPSSSSHPHISFGHLYTPSDVDSLWGANYKPEQKNPIGFVSTFDKNLIRSAGVQNATDSAKVFL